MMIRGSIARHCTFATQNFHFLLFTAILTVSTVWSGNRLSCHKENKISSSCVNTIEMIHKSGPNTPTPAAGHLARWQYYHFLVVWGTPADCVHFFFVNYDSLLPYRTVAVNLRRWCPIVDNSTYICFS